MADDNINAYSKDLQKELTEHPAIVDGINKMIREGYSDESIHRIIGGAATPEVIDHHRQMIERTGSRSRRTDSEIREYEEKRAADRKR